MLQFGCQQEAPKTATHESTLMRTPLAATLTIATIAATGLTGCAAETWTTMTRVQSPASSWTTATRDGYWLYGDSITVQTRDATARAIHAATTRQVAVDANSGIPTAPAVDRLAERVKLRGAPRDLIMATGANDAVDPARYATMAANIARVRAIVGPTTRITWVTAMVIRPKTATSDRKGTDAVNYAINTAHKRGTINRVIPWHTVAAKAGLAKVTRDGVHPNPVGVPLYVKTVTEGAR